MHRVARDVASSKPLHPTVIVARAPNRAVKPKLFVGSLVRSSVKHGRPVVIRNEQQRVIDLGRGDEEQARELGSTGAEGHGWFINERQADQDQPGRLFLAHHDRCWCCFCLRLSHDPRRPRIVFYIRCSRPAFNGLWRCQIGCAI